MGRCDPLADPSPAAPVVRIAARVSPWDCPVPGNAKRLLGRNRVRLIGPDTSLSIPTSSRISPFSVGCSWAVELGRGLLAETRLTLSLLNADRSGLQGVQAREGKPRRRNAPFIPKSNGRPLISIFRSTVPGIRWSAQGSAPRMAKLATIASHSSCLHGSRHHGKCISSATERGASRSFFRPGRADPQWCRRIRSWFRGLGIAPCSDPTWETGSRATPGQERARSRVWILSFKRHVARFGLSVRCNKIGISGSTAANSEEFSGSELVPSRVINNTALPSPSKWQAHLPAEVSAVIFHSSTKDTLKFGQLDGILDMAKGPSQEPRTLRIQHPHVINQG
jgi:hypothetical protein